MTSTRVRSVSGRSCLNTDFHSWVSVSQFHSLVPGPSSARW